MIVRVEQSRNDIKAARVIDSAEKLRALARPPLILSLTPDAPLSLTLAELTKAESEDWQSRLNREWMACGCRAGEVAAGLAVAGYIGAALLGALPAMASTWSHIGWAVLAALLAAAAGKILGRARSLLRFRRTVEELDAVFARRRPMIAATASSANYANG